MFPNQLSNAYFHPDVAGGRVTKPVGEGARIAIITPAGPIEPERIEAGRGRLIAEGWSVDVVGPLSSNHGAGFLAASDEDRARSLKEALHTYDVAILSRGGYGTARLLDTTSARWLTSGQAWVVGYSDATALLWAQRAVDPTYLGGVHGPTTATIGTHDSGSSFDRLVALLRGHPVEPISVSHLCGPNVTVSGPIIAGNLAVATSLIGTPWLPQLDGHIVVFEDVNEAPYRVDRMLTQWRQSGALNGVVAVALGRFSYTPADVQPADDDSAPGAQVSSTSDEMRAVFVDRLAELKIPVYETTAIGHDGVCEALPIGALSTVGTNGIELHNSAPTTDSALD